MKKVVGQSTREKISKVEKMIKLHHDLQKSIECKDKKL